MTIIERPQPILFARCILGMSDYQCVKCGHVGHSVRDDYTVAAQGSFGMITFDAECEGCQLRSIFAVPFYTATLEP